MPKLSLIGLYEISLDGSNINYQLKKSFRARRMRLEINVNTGLSVIVPRRYDISSVKTFIIQKRNWIIKKLKEVQFYKAIPDDGTLESICYLGRQLKLIISKGNQEYALVNIITDEITVSIKSDENVVLMLSNWYLQEADRVIRQKASIFSKLIGVNYNNLSVKSVKTRWGSCSRLGNLSFNWKLVMLPEVIIDYVVIHELCHLKRMDHSKLFWQLVESYSPEFCQHRHWLKQHEAEINRRRFNYK